MDNEAAFLEFAEIGAVPANQNRVNRPTFFRNRQYYNGRYYPEIRVNLFPRSRSSTLVLQNSTQRSEFQWPRPWHRPPQWGGAGGPGQGRGGGDRDMQHRRCSILDMFELKFGSQPQLAAYAGPCWLVWVPTTRVPWVPPDSTGVCTHIP